MSRCFPYPPLGFEKKARGNLPDLLAKEQQKEKKHKKEKRDREKEEGEEKKHRDKSRHKHEEKKDRKERHKDKKRDNDKNRSFDDDRKIGGQTSFQEKAGVSVAKVEEIKDSTFVQEFGGRIKDEKGEANRVVDKVSGVSISKAESVKESRFTEELGKRIKDEKGEANRMLEKVSGVRKCKAEEVKDYRFNEELGKRIKDEKREANRLLEKVSGVSNSKAEEVKDSRFTEELGRRMEIERKVAANRMLENITCPIPKRVEGLGTKTAPEKERGNRSPVAANFIRKEQTKANGVTRPVDRVNHDHRVFTNGNPLAANLILKEPKRDDGIGQSLEKGNINHQNLYHRNPAASNFIGTEQRRVYGIPQAVEKGIHNHQTLLQTPLEKYEIKSIEHKENGKCQEANNKHGDSHRDRENEKKIKENGKNREREKKREEKWKRENDENNHKDHGRPKDREKKDQVDNLSFNLSVSPINNGNFAGNNGHSNKRKEFEMNGFLHEDEVPPNKPLRPASSSHQQNGRTIEFDHIHAAHPSIRHGIPNNIKAEVMMNNKIHSINDTAIVKTSSADLRHSLAADTSGKSKITTKMPHPDCKFLSQIYSIPKKRVLSEYDDQDWLFGSSNHQPKPKEEIEAEEAPQVWAQGMKIESTDVFALPYVIPY